MDKVSDSGNKKKVILGAVLVGVVVFISYSMYRRAHETKDKNVFSPPAVTVSTAEFGPVVRYINAIGTLRPFDSVIIKSEVQAKIDKIHFTEGALVKEGDLLIELDDSSAKAELMEAEAMYRKARSEFDPAEKLADRGVESRKNRDTKKADVDTCAARVSFKRSNLEKHKIYAPFGGIVGLKEVSKGQFVSPNAEMVKIVDCHPIKVDFKVAESVIDKIYVDQEVKILVGGDKAQEFMAKIVAIDPESETISHSFNVRAILDVPEAVALSSQTLRPGKFVSVKIPLDGDQRGILIPESSLEKIGDEYTVFRVVDGLAFRTLITAGVRRDGSVEVITGVNEGDVIVTSGQSGVLDGKEVLIKNDASVSDIADAVNKMYKNRKVATKKNVANPAAK